MVPIFVIYPYSTHLSLILFITMKRLYEPCRVKVALCSTSFCTSCPFFSYWVTDKSTIFIGLVSSTLAAVIVYSPHSLFILIITSWHDIKEQVSPVSAIKMFGSLSRFYCLRSSFSHPIFSRFLHWWGWTPHSCLRSSMLLTFLSPWTVVLGSLLRILFVFPAVGLAVPLRYAQRWRLVSDDVVYVYYFCRYYDT